MEAHGGTLFEPDTSIPQQVSALQWLFQLLSHPLLAAVELHRLELNSLRCSQQRLFPNAVWWQVPHCASPLKGNWWSCSVPKTTLGNSFLTKIFPGHACTSKCFGLMTSHQCCFETSFLALRPQCLNSASFTVCFFTCMFWSLWTFQAISLLLWNCRWVWLQRVTYGMKAPIVFFPQKM